MRNFVKMLVGAAFCALLTIAFLSLSPVKSSAVGMLAGDAEVCTANLNANVFADATAATFAVFRTPLQGGGCYNPCNNAYRRCQKKNGRYNKACRTAFARCWGKCNASFGVNNPMPAP
jgi:hypothetical protein